MAERGQAIVTLVSAPCRARIHDPGGDLRLLVAAPELSGGDLVLVRQRSHHLWGARARAEHLIWTSTLGTRALSPRLSAHDPVARLAGAPRAQRHLERRGNLGVAARGCGPAPSGLWVSDAVLVETDWFG